jgi:hyperosmotically inducible protein
MMKKSAFAVLCLVLGPFAAQAVDRADANASATVEHANPDNTKVNVRDRNHQNLTPLDQSNNKADIDLTQAIRKSVMKNHLSMNAKNIKIISINGDVTLRGPVRNNAEKDKIAKLAKAVSGVNSLNNELEVKAK